MSSKNRIQKNIGFAERDLKRLQELYEKSKTKAGFGAFLALRILGETELKSLGWAESNDAKAESKKKTAKLSFRCTEKQLELFKNYYSQSTSKSIGDFFEMAIKRGKIISMERRTLPAEQMLEINRIGNNLNQIARKINSLSPGGPDNSIFIEIQRDLTLISDMLKSVLG